MPSRTHSDKIDELYRLVYILTQQVNELRQDVIRSDDNHQAAAEKAAAGLAESRREAAAEVAAARAEARDKVAELRAAVDQVRIDLAVQRRDIDDIRTRRDEWGRRAWAVLLALVSAAIGGGVTYLLKR